MIEIIPAIDIIGGKCTRLSQGDYATQKDYGGDPAEWARAYADCGVRRLHLVDLEGAKASKPKNLRTLEEIASLGLLTLEWGGGIKDDEALASVWNAGADEAIIGSIAAKEPARMTAWLERWGSRVILGADVRDGKVAVSGWQGCRERLARGQRHRPGRTHPDLPARRPEARHRHGHFPRRNAAGAFL